VSEKIDATEARRLFIYKPDTGKLVWRVKPSIGVKAGQEAGWLTATGYLRVRLRGTNYPVHRLAWLITFGEWPVSTVDHINGMRDDNRLENLRLATRAQQNMNMARRTGKPLPKGVKRQHRRFAAKITVSGRKIFIGQYPTPEEAHAAYMAAARRYFGDFAFNGERQ